MLCSVDGFVYNWEQNQIWYMKTYMYFLFVCFKMWLQVLDHDEKNVTILVQRALLYESMEKYKLGAEDLRMVLKIDPGNRIARSTVHRLTKMAGWLIDSLIKPSYTDISFIVSKYKQSSLQIFFCCFPLNTFRLSSMYLVCVVFLSFFFFFDGSAYAVCGLWMYCHQYGFYYTLHFFEFITEYLTMNVFIKATL